MKYNLCKNCNNNDNKYFCEICNKNICDNCHKVYEEEKHNTLNLNVNTRKMYKIYSKYSKNLRVKYYTYKR